MFDYRRPLAESLGSPRIGFAWPTASPHHSLGQRPGTLATPTIPLANGHIHLLLIKIIGVDLLQRKSLIMRDADVVFNHQLAESLAVDQHHILLPAFGLHVNHVEAEPILADNSINTLVVGRLGDFGCFGSGTAIAHREQQIDDKQIDDKLLELVRVHATNLSKQLIRQP